MDRQSLSAVIRGIQHAAASSFRLLGEQHLQVLRQYFDESEDGVLHARTTYVQVDDDHWVPVPLIALVNPRSLSLSRMKVAMSVRIEEAEGKPGDGAAAGEVDRTSFSVVVSPKGSADGGRDSEVTDLELEFTAGDPPDAMQRLIEVFAQLVDPNNRHIDRAMTPGLATRLGAGGNGRPRTGGQEDGSP